MRCPQATRLVPEPYVARLYSLVTVCRDFRVAPLVTSRLRHQRAQDSLSPNTQLVYEEYGERVAEQITWENGYTTGSHILAKNTTLYDTLKRPSTQRSYEVGRGTLTGNYIETNSFYDGAGRLVKQTAPGGGFSKTLFDGRGRPTTQAFCASEGTSTSAEDLTDDTVLTEVNTQYSAAGGRTSDFKLFEN